MRECVWVPMAESISLQQSDEAVDMEKLRSLLTELAESVRLNIIENAEISWNSKDLLEDCLQKLPNTTPEIELEEKPFASLLSEDSEVVLEQLKREFQLVEDERRKIDDEIMDHMRIIDEDSIQLYSDLEALDCSLKLSSSEDVHKSQGTTLAGEAVYRDLQGGIMYACEDEKFKIFQLDHQIEKVNAHLTFLKNLESVFRRDEAIGQIEDMLCEVIRPIEVGENCIRLSIGTSISTLGGSLLEQKLDFVINPLVLYHVLAIEVVNETSELKNIEIFPNDVCLDNIITVAKASRRLFSPYSVPSVKSSLKWLVRKVKQQILLCNLRRLVVKDANNSRHSLEYLDKDEIIIAHLVGGIDAFIKVSHGWPISSSALQLVSIKGSDIHSKVLLLSVFYKIKEEANSLDMQISHHLSRFADAIEEIVVREMHPEI